MGCAWSRKGVKRKARPNSTNLKKLFQKMKGGDEAAFKKLFQTYRDRLVWYATNLLNGDRDAAEDVVQDAFIELTRMIPTLVRLTPAFVRGQVVFKIVRYRKRKTRLKETSLESADGLSAEDTPPTHDHASNDSPENAETLRFFKEALMTLPDRDRTILLMKADGATYQQIADAISTPENERSADDVRKTDYPNAKGKLIKAIRNSALGNDYDSRSME